MKSTSTRFALTGAVWAMYLVSCSRVPEPAGGILPLDGAVPITKDEIALPTRVTDNVEANPSILQVTTIDGDGNHLVPGSGGLDAISPIEVQLDFRPVWLLGMEMKPGSGWVAVSEMGEVDAFQVIGGIVSSVDIEPGSIPAGMPPAVYYDGVRLQLLLSNDPEAAPYTNPVYLKGSNRLAYINLSGDLILTVGGASERLVVGALPDARLLVDENDRILFLGRRTERYAHAALGDGYEAGSILIVTTKPHLVLVQEIILPEREVFEGISPIWQDIDQDGIREIFVTISDRDQGAYLAMFSEDGSLLGRSEAIGRPSRWRHQLTVADFLGTGQYEIAAVLTPHIGGILEFFTWEEGDFEFVAGAGGVSSHRLGSRNLDMALSGDFDKDQQLELLVPNPSFDVLIAFQREADEIVHDWELPLGSRLSTNLAGVRFKDGQLGLGLGLENGLIRLWLPQ